ncbi:MAG: hypothetical protein HKN92_02195 [Chitinophagales bacterium]|nr:hypothetical protein [Chitinophagales bacterium]
MIRNLLLLGVLLGVNIPSILKEQTLLESQLQYEKVEEAFKKFDKSWEEICAERNLVYPPDNLFVRVFKREKIVEVWGSGGDDSFVLLKDFPICALSGDLGPKRMEGDKQVPEGVYNVELFNPVSKYHLSVKINYPNKSDKILGHRIYPGSNIFFHGGCKTIGCIPLTDELIKEFYTLALKSYSNNGKLPVHIFPFKMDGEEYEKACEEMQNNKKFWSEIQPIYQFFETKKALPIVSIDNGGSYRLVNLN